MRVSFFASACELVGAWKGNVGEEGITNTLKKRLRMKHYKSQSKKNVPVSLGGKKNTHTPPLQK
jgi:hypothetical protein